MTNSTTIAAPSVAVTPVFPSPAERPTAAVVIYDGECRICTGYMTGLQRLDRQQQLAYLSLHDPEVARRWPDLRHDALMESMVVIDQHGRRYWGADALRYFSRQFPLLWPVAPVLHVPGTLPVWQWLYRHFAKRRYHFGRVESCVDGSCQIPRRS